MRSRGAGAKSALNFLSAAVAFAKASPLPKPEDALLDVFAP